ncbi:sulfotransferase [Ramlibacter sp.]|uniref:sulfotransferase family protein n=1 Tax=Ramlibacter sp. TaxID=1917967 RepID=UPI00181A0210|nr:sulfotransferase [Ramlibacter sp.]MBA2672883.1 sulfotransferase [Ramlibacter sp.]
MPGYHFISGLPRAGSTLLAAILRQNPRFRAGMTSPVGALTHGVLTQVSAGSEFGAMVDKPMRQRLLKGIFDSYYGDVPSDGVVFDTNRVWSARIGTLLDLYPGAKVIACVRNVAWVMDSIERLYRADPYEHTRLFGGNMARSTVYSRLEGLAQHDQLVGFAWSGLREAFYGEHASSMLVLDYELLAQAPHKVIPLVYDFIGEPRFEHDFDNVEYDAPDFDVPLGTPGLHKVRPKVELQARKPVIPPDLFEKYAQLSFWNDPAGSAAYVVTAQPVKKQSQ